jgi:hypothetical protein
MNWFWRKKPPANPRVTVELVGGERAVVTVDWPDAAGAEGKAKAADGLATLLYCLSDGKLLHLIQEAVAVAGKLKGDGPVAERVLALLNHLSLRGRPPEGGPVIPADQVFSRGE